MSSRARAGSACCIASCQIVHLFLLGQICCCAHPCRAEDVIADVIVVTLSTRNFNDSPEQYESIVAVFRPAEGHAVHYSATYSSCAFSSDPCASNSASKLSPVPPFSLSS